MDGQNFVVFHNAADDSYGNSTNNFRGAYANTETIDVYFASATTAGGYDKVVLACTNGEEDRALEQVLSAIGGAKAGGFTVIQDDVNSVSAGRDILSVTSITLSATGQVLNILNGVMDGSNADLGGTAHSLVFDNKHSGSVVVLAATTATSTMTLPASPVAGFNLRFVAASDNSAHTNTIAGSFFGVLSDGGDNTSVTGTSAAVVVASKLKLGDEFEIVYSGIGAKYYLRAILKTADGITVS
tara:strand:+ start:26 stop:751 length:726 start_codon:yes stop_codon:yes gene_type:complete